MKFYDGFGGPTLDELIESQPVDVRDAINDVIYYAGTSDADWQILLAAGRIIAELRTK